MDQQGGKIAAELGSGSLVYDPQNLCRDCGERAPEFTWNEGEWSDWNGGARLCYPCAEKTAKEHAEFHEEYGSYKDPDPDERQSKVERFRTEAAAVLAHSTAKKG